MNSALRTVLLAVGLTLLLAFIGRRAFTPEAPHEALLRQAQWKLGPAGKLWNKARSQLPLRWQMDVPSSSAPDWLSASGWLSVLANNPEVAQSIVRTWPRWNPEARELWLFWIQDRRQVLSSEYLPLIRTELVQNPKFSYHLLATLARNQPLSAADIELMVQFLKVQFQVLDPNEKVYLLTQLAALDAVPREVLVGLTALPESEITEVALVARITIFQLDPAGHPLSTTLEPRFPQLSLNEQIQLLTHLRAPEFQRGETPAWSLARVTDLVRSCRSAGITPTRDLKNLFSFLEGVGPSGSALALDVASWITAESSDVRAPAADALTQLSPPTPELLATLLPHLAFDSATVTILTWLAAHPRHSQAAEPVVARLCQGHAPHQANASAVAGSSQPLDPSKARRGRGANRPEGLQLGCRPKSVPLVLLPGWPRYRSLHQVIAVSIPETNSTRFQAVLQSRLPEVTFRELAEHCLTEIRAAQNAPTNHPASPKGSDR